LPFAVKYGIRALGILHLGEQAGVREM